MLTEEDVEACLLPPLSRPMDELSDGGSSELAPFLERLPTELERLTGVLNANPWSPSGELPTGLLTQLLFLLCEVKAWRRESHDELHASVARCFGFSPTRRFPDEKRFQGLDDAIFRLSMERLHAKLTKDDWKRQPGALDAFRFVLKEWTLLHKVRCAWPLVFPAVFLQLDDCDQVNKLEGLKCCHSVLRNMSDTSEVSYETVIYDALARYLRHPEPSVLSGALQCTILLLPLTDAKERDARWNKLDDVLETVLDKLRLDPPDALLSRTYWKYLPHLMNLNANCALRWKKRLLALLADAVRANVAAAVFKYDSVVDPLRCLDCWLKIAWPVWNFHSDKSLIVLTVAVLYRRGEYVESSPEVQCLNLMLSLCDDEQRKWLLSERRSPLANLSEDFQKIWHKIKQ